jgi:hypothetical protein
MIKNKNEYCRMYRKIKKVMIPFKDTHEVRSVVNSKDKIEINGVPRHKNYVHPGVLYILAAEGIRFERIDGQQINHPACGTISIKIPVMQPPLPPGR